MSFKLKDAMGGFGWLVAAVMGVSGLLVGDAVDPADEVTDLVASSPAGFECPAGYETTQGVDPETQASFTTCDNGRIIVTKRDGGEPVVFDTLTGKFLESLP